MAVGDEAASIGLPLVPDSGEEGKVKWGSREFNRTRDFIAQIWKLLPVGKAGYRTAAGLSYGTSVPTGGDDGDIYFQIVN